MDKDLSQLLSFLMLAIAAVIAAKLLSSLLYVVSAAIQPVLVMVVMVAVIGYLFKLYRTSKKEKE